MSNIFIKKGDLIVLDGKHKIYCGDAMEKTSYSFMERKATMSLTSPPYNVGKSIGGRGKNN